MDRVHRYQADLLKRGQDHLLRWWNDLNSAQQGALLDEIAAVPWDLLDSVIPTHVLRKPREAGLTNLEPAPVVRRGYSPADELGMEDAIKAGRDMLRRGTVAAMTVAGGQGTRLGLDGPKGLLAVTPVGNKTLFELFALTVLAARNRYETAIPWYIMTSPTNHESTLAYFQGQDFFGLPKRDLLFFSQGVLPAFDFQGKVLLSDKAHLALSPDGHGGALKALVQSGALADMQRRGIQTISYFQIDNPLVKPFDPLFLGLHGRARSEMSTKVAAKTDDLERVGNVCLQDGRIRVIEYSDFPEALAQSRDAQGRRKFDAGNLAIHLLDVAFVERIIARSFQMPFRRAEKAVPFLDDSGRIQRPQAPNAVKLETFVFDVLPLANHPLVFEVDRAEEFSPVKNAAGPDSLETSKHDQVARACRWLDSAGVNVPRRPDGSPEITIAISPKLALDAEDLRTRVTRIPQLFPGMTQFLDD